MIKFNGTCTISVTGQTGSGKTSFIHKLLKNKSQMFEPEPTGIMYCYSVYQKAYDDMQHDNKEVLFHSGLPNETEMNEFLDGTHSHCL